MDNDALPALNGDAPCAAVSGDAPSAAVSGDTPSAAVSGDELMRHTREFARRQKLSGTPEELESFRYLEAEMRGLGFRTRLLGHEAYISLPGRASVLIDGRPLKAITQSFSRPSPPGGLKAPLVDLGEGSPADFAGRDLRGRILLVEGIASPAIAARAKAAGAAGQLHISPQEHLHEMCISPVWGNPGASTLAELPETVVCTIAQSEGAGLRARLAAGEAPEVVLEAEVDTGWRETPLLEAEMDAPAGPEAPFILFSGHHDTWYFGVMDNGTANATMIEAARVLAAHRGAWRRGLRLCFWSGHSHGRYSGSAWYADTRFDDLARRCAAHVNVDSTGGIGATDMTHAGTTPELAPLAARAIAAETGQRHAGNRPGRNGDQSFWGIGIPSMFCGVSSQVPGTETFGPSRMRNPLGWWWHTPEDTIDKIDEAFLLRDTRVYVRTLWHLLTDARLPMEPLAAVAALAAELGGLPERVRAAEPVAALIARAEALAVRPLPETLPDAALIAASRPLVLLNMTLGDRFVHDPALPLPAWPVLAPLRAWGLAAPGSEAARFAAVDARRACNRLGAALDEVARALGCGC